MLPTTIVVLLLALFTGQGPASMVIVSENMEACTAKLATVDGLVGKKIPGANGEETVILDAQGICKEFTQQRQATK